MSEVHDDRLALGRAAIFSLNTAARLLPWADAKARDWLRAQGLVITLDDRRLVVWADVIDALTVMRTEVAAAAQRKALKPTKGKGRRRGGLPSLNLSPT